jgi:uncharacterized membrane protein YgcG
MRKRAGILRNALLGAFVSVFVSFPSFAAEVIYSYDVLAKVQKDGSVAVEEDISVIAEGDQIKRGIYRDFPTRYRGRFGENVVVGFELTGVYKNGMPEPYHTERQSNGIRIYAGQKDVFLSRGNYRYTFQYTVHDVIGFFGGFDEFYWNVTGNGWVFPITRAKIRVELPEGAAAGDFAGYTGPQGAQGTDYIAGKQGNVFEAATTRPLSSYEGFTIAVAFPKGFVHQPTGIEKAIAFFKSNPELASIVLMTALLFVYYLIVWNKWGRDLPKGTAFPRFEPPEGVSPDLLRYVVNQGYDNKTFVTLLVEAAVHGHLGIRENEDETELLKQTRLGATPIPQESQDVLFALFGGKTRYEIPKIGFFSSKASETERRIIAQHLQLVKTTHQETFEKAFRDQYFVTNTALKVLGGLVLVASLAVIFLSNMADDDKVFFAFGTFLAQAPIHGLFWKLLSKYTPEGRDLMAYADGLKMFLTVAEQARLDALYPKEITPEKFEEMLPYALALDVEQEWTEHFAALVESGAVAYDQENRVWYRSTHHRDLYHLGGALGGSLSSMIASASTPPGSKSGSGGGGSSGGGGGGGGGGGW